MQSTNRFENAVSIVSGACNPSGIARTLVEACDEARQDGVSASDDAAVRLIVSQLAYLCGVWNGISEWSTGSFSLCHTTAKLAVRKPEEGA